MKPDYLSSVEIEPRQPAAATVIWLHGLGADGHDFEPVVPSLGLGAEHRIRFVFPHAPPIPVTINGGLVMPAWYDIRNTRLEQDQDEGGISRATGQVWDLIGREGERGVKPESIVLAGFSQGGAVALHAGLTYHQRLAGLVALSTYLVLPERLEETAAPANLHLPVFQAHGRFDPMVPVDRGEDACRRLQSAGHRVTWHDYPMMHGVCLEEVEALGAWLEDVLGPEAFGTSPAPK